MPGGHHPIPGGHHWPLRQSRLGPGPPSPSCRAGHLSDAGVCLGPVFPPLREEGPPSQPRSPSGGQRLCPSSGTIKMSPSAGQQLGGVRGRVSPILQTPRVCPGLSLAKPTLGLSSGSPLHPGAPHALNGCAFQPDWAPVHCRPLAGSEQSSCTMWGALWA